MERKSSITAIGLAGSTTVRIAIALMMAACLPAAQLLADSRDEHDYVIGPRDVLQIHVFNQPDLSGPYTVEIDGYLSFPLIGRLAAAQTTVRAFEQVLSDRLAAGYFKSPRVSVTISEYNSQRVFIIGEVRRPGAYPLTGTMSIIELLALAGGTTQVASGEAVRVRGGPNSSGPSQPTGSQGTETTRVNLKAFEAGDLSQNVRLQDGDTVVVLATEVVYVEGEVRNPGQYPIRSETTVLQALSLAGGGTEFAALNRIRIVRTENGKQVDTQAQLNTLVRPDDIIRVPVRYF